MREQLRPIVEISGSPIDRELFAGEPAGPGRIESVFGHRTHCITGLAGRKNLMYWTMHPAKTSAALLESTYQRFNPAPRRPV